MLEEKTEQLGGGTYELLKSRIDTQVKELPESHGGLNTQRKDIFGSIATSLIGSDKVTTPNNCIARIYYYGQQFYFRLQCYTWFKSQTNFEDVFAVIPTKMDAFMRKI